MGSGGETCRTSRYDARTFVMETVDLPAEEVKKIARKNTKAFLDIPKHRRREPEILEAAATLSKRKFDEFVEREVPEAHREVRRSLEFYLERSAYDFVNSAIQTAMEQNDLPSKEKVLEAWAAEFVTDHLEEAES